MRICFYAPFKPLGHPNPSGDLIIATGLSEHLQEQGHEIIISSTLRSRWIYWKPWNLIRVLATRARIIRQWTQAKPDLWLTYHSYYKAPDMLGPIVAKKLRIPYVIFQGIYSTKVRRNWRTRPGYFLNRRALLAADLVLTNRQGDLTNLQRLLPDTRLKYLAPGIHPDQFTLDPAARKHMRQEWQVGDTPVILAAAMFRPDVKTQGLTWVIESCARLVQQGNDLRLIIAGDGRERAKLTTLGEKLLGDKISFTGKIPREKMAEFYSGGDLFVFPGINESLGMVFLEAQSCGLPVVAFDTAGVPEVVLHGETGLLTPPFAEKDFDRAVTLLLTNELKRKNMGAAAAHHIRAKHDLNRNYNQLGQLLENISSKGKRS